MYGGRRKRILRQESTVHYEVFSRRLSIYRQNSAASVKPGGTTVGFNDLKYVSRDNRSLSDHIQWRTYHIIFLRQHSEHCVDWLSNSGARDCRSLCKKGEETDKYDADAGGTDARNAAIEYVVSKEN